MTGTVQVPATGSVTVPLAVKDQYDNVMTDEGGAITYDTAGLFSSVINDDSVTFTALASSGTAVATYTDGNASDEVTLVVAASVATTAAFDTTNVTYNEATAPASSTLTASAPASSALGTAAAAAV